MFFPFLRPFSTHFTPFFRPLRPRATRFLCTLSAMNVENFDDVSRHLRLHGAETVRINLSERTKARDGGREGVIVVGNWDVPVGAATHSPLDMTTDQDQDQDDGVEEPEAAGTSPAPAWVPTAMAWIRTRASSHARLYQRDAKFQVKLYRAGGGYIVSCSFHVVNVARAETPSSAQANLSFDRWAAQQAHVLEGMSMDPALYPPINEVSGAAHSLMLEMVGTTGAWLRNLIFPSVGQVVKLNEYQVLNLMRQVDTLQGSVRSYEAIVAEKDRTIADRDRQILLYESAEGADARSRMERAKALATVADKLGDMGKTYLASRIGIPPAMMPLLFLIIQNQDLAAALADPRIAELLKDPEERASIVALLRRLAVAYEAQQAEKKKQQDEGQQDSRESPTEQAPKAPEQPSMHADFGETA